MTSSYVRVDGSPSSQLAYCEQCPSWRELRGERPAALAAAAAHAQLVHGDAPRAQKLRELAARATHRTS